MRSRSRLVATAHAVVDSVVAVHQVGLPLSPEWAVVGQSQGGGAAVNSARWATSLHRSAHCPVVSDALDEYMGTPVTGYDRPIFLGAGLLDTDVPAKSSLVFYDQLKANNQDVILNIYPEEDHSGTVLASIPDSTPFLAALFADGH